MALVDGEFVDDATFSVLVLRACTGLRWWSVGITLTLDLAAGSLEWTSTPNRSVTSSHGNSRLATRTKIS